VPSPDSAVRVDDLVVKFGRHAVLDGLALEAKAGALTAVLGPNGAGKTTLIRCCTGLLAADSGTVTVLGRSAGSAEVAARVGLMPQSTGAWSGIKAVELLRYLAGLYAHPHDVEALVRRCGITSFARTPYRRLSGGQQQAVNLAGALIGRPELVFLDEPTAGLDPTQIRETRKLMRELGQQHTMLLSTHILSEVEATCDSVIVIYQGRVVEDGTLAAVRKRHADKSLEDIFVKLTGQEGI
jgi:ABC-2 type transport system ATP-binding protein